MEKSSCRTFSPPDSITAITIGLMEPPPGSGPRGSAPTLAPEGRVIVPAITRATVALCRTDLRRALALFSMLESLRRLRLLACRRLMGLNKVLTRFNKKCKPGRAPQNGGTYPKGGHMRLRRVLVGLALIGAMLAGGAPTASASTTDADPVSATFCPAGWYGVILGVQQPSGVRYITACVQA